MGVTIRKRKLENGEISLYLDYYDRGQRSYEFLKLHLTGDKTSDKEKLRLAEIVRNQKEIDLFAGTFNLVPSHRKKTTLVEYSRPIVGKKNRSNGNAFLVHMEKFFGTTKLCDISEKLLEEFQTALEDFGLKSSTIETYLNLLGSILNLAVREKYIVDNPLRNAKRHRAEDPVLEYLSIDECELLSRTPIMGESGLGGKIKKAFLFSCQTALRWSDAISLTWGAVASPDKNGQRQIAKRQVKTKDVVYIPLSADAWKLIDDHLEHKDDDLVFGILSKTDPNQYLVPWGKKAGIKTGLYFHLARHTAATLLLENGVDIAVVQKIVGHKSIEQTLRYAKVTNRLKREAVDGLKMDLNTQPNTD